MNKLVIPAILIMGVSGCSTINPERSIASELVGKNVSEAVERLAPSMGNPRYITRSISNPEYTFYEWVSNEGYYDHVQPAGTLHDEA